MTENLEEYLSNIERATQEAREQKRQFFNSDDPHSPVPSEEFVGLDYFPVLEEYVVVATYHEFPDEEKEIVEIGTTSEGAKKYLRWAELSFTIDGNEYTLNAYKSDLNSNRLWVPFRDETNGDETYGAGRYIDLDVSQHFLSKEKVILDFNQAYNPTCAYNTAVECPMIPRDNWLDTRIEVGEKDYPGEPVHQIHSHTH